MILHIVMDDILQFGVPLEYDTSANESFHKAAKKASKMTQRAAETFNFQVANRLIEFEVIDLAMEEIKNGLLFPGISTIEGRKSLTRSWKMNLSMTFGLVRQKLLLMWTRIVRWGLFRVLGQNLRVMPVEHGRA